MAPPSPWSDEKIRQLRELWPTAASAGDIAKALGQGFTRNSVLGRAFRMNLPLRAKSPNGNRNGGQPKPRKPRPMVLNLKAPEPPKPLPPQPPPPLVMRRLSIFELEPHHCRWPLWPEEKGQLYCAANKVAGRPYCYTHTKTAYHKLNGG